MYTFSASVLFENVFECVLFLSFLNMHCACMHVEAVNVSKFKFNDLICVCSIVTHHECVKSPTQENKWDFGVVFLIIIYLFIILFNLAC